MRHLCRFAQLSNRARGALIQAYILLWAIRIGLWVLPFLRLLALVVWAIQARRRIRRPSTDAVQTVAWAVHTGSRYVPSATCLTQALAGQILLARYGYASELRIGVAQASGRDFEAHAWLLYDDEVVIGGGGDLSRFTPLPPLG